MRETLLLVECSCPANMRTLVVVRSPSELSTPLLSILLASSFWSNARPASSGAVVETSEALAPRLATFTAQFAAPPGTVSVYSCLRIKTGASRETLLMAPKTNWSAIASPTTRTFCCGKRLTMLISRSCNKVRSMVTYHLPQFRDRQGGQSVAQPQTDLPLPGVGGGASCPVVVPIHRGHNHSRQRRNGPRRCARLQCRCSDHQPSNCDSSPQRNPRPPRGSILAWVFGNRNRVGKAVGPPKDGGHSNKSRQVWHRRPLTLFLGGRAL